MATTDAPIPSDKSIILKGIVWTTGYRVFATLAQFGAMLVLVRIIPPEEYGRAGAVVVRVLFPSVLRATMQGVPGGARLGKWLRLPPREAAVET